MNKNYSLRQMIVSILESEKDKNFTSREITLKIKEKYPDYYNERYNKFKDEKTTIQRISSSVTNSLSSISFPNAILFTAKPKLSWKYISDEEENRHDNDNYCTCCGRPFD